MPCDHLDPGAVRALVQRVDDAHVRLDVLVDDIWGGEMMVEWEAEPTWSPRTTRCTDSDGSQPDTWRYIVEVQDPGRPADVTGYR